MVRAMERTTNRLAALLAGMLGLVAGCGEKGASGVPTATATASVTAAATTTAAGSATPTSAPTTVTTTTSDATETSEPQLELTKWACGAKGQKPCPMQGWMKKVMAPASSSGDGEKLSEALTYAGKRPPPGYDQWVAISKEGAAKAKAGDIDGAKASCKKCHDAYKQDYRMKMRDRAW
ncbi:Hypothetical protein A7982_03786 [Minicystis rosea]|nr:Hypothetical protein A7982_03786 [Minicystis rosea]